MVSFEELLTWAIYNLAGGQPDIDRARILCEPSEDGYLERTFDLTRAPVALTNQPMLGSGHAYIPPFTCNVSPMADVGAAVRAQKSHRRGDIRRLPQPAQRNLAIQGFALRIVRSCGSCRYR